MGKGQSSIGSTYGQVVFCKSNSELTRKEEYMDEVIHTCYLRSCRMLHGSYSWLATLAVKAISAGISSPLEHWWVILESSQAYYSVQIWVNDKITIERGTSWERINQNGLYNADRPADSQQWTISKSKCNKKLSEFADFINYHLQYGYTLGLNNCQDISKAIYALEYDHLKRL